MFCATNGGGDLNGFFVPSNRCGPTLSKAEHVGSLIPVDQNGEIYAAVVQEDCAKRHFIMYAVTEKGRFIQMLRPQSSITSTPSENELVLEATTRKEYRLSKPYFCDSSVRYAY